MSITKWRSVFFLKNVFGDIWNIVFPISFLEKVHVYVLFSLGTSCSFHSTLLDFVPLRFVSLRFTPFSFWNERQLWERISRNCSDLSSLFSVWLGCEHEIGHGREWVVDDVGWGCNDVSACPLSQKFSNQLMYISSVTLKSLVAPVATVAFSL